MANKAPHAVIDAAAAAAAAKADELAAEASAAPAVPEQSTVLAYGAAGECVSKLVNLLDATGYLTRTPAEVTTVDEQLLADVQAAQAALQVAEPEVIQPAEAQAGIKGTLVGQATWTALYEAAAAKLGVDASTEGAQAS